MATQMTRTCCATSCVDTLAVVQLDEDRLEQQRRLLESLADPTRLRIVHLLAQHDSLCVCELEAAFDLGQPTISHHLRLLREAGLVTATRRGTWAYYALSRPVLKSLVSDLLAVV